MQNNYLPCLLVGDNLPAAGELLVLGWSACCLLEA
jgi:hypothetical protein